MLREVDWRSSSFLLIFMFLVASPFDGLKCAVADFPHMKRFNVQSKNTECALQGDWLISCHSPPGSFICVFNCILRRLLPLIIANRPKNSFDMKQVNILV